MLIENLRNVQSLRVQIILFRIYFLSEDELISEETT